MLLYTAYFSSTTNYSDRYYVDVGKRDVILDSSSTGPMIRDPTKHI